MIENITKRLCNYIVSVNMEYEHKISDYRRGEMIAKLQTALNEYEATPTALYDELYKPWAKDEIITFLRLVDNLMDKPDEWQELSIGKYGYIIPDIVNRLNLLYDEIVSKAPKNIISCYQNGNEALCLPTKLNTPEVLKIFAEAQKLGLMDEQYKWLKGLQLLACFAREISLKFKWGKGLIRNGEPRISWQPFEQFYGLKKYTLRSNYNDIQKTNQQPSDIALIDQLFK